MSEACRALHELANRNSRHRFPLEPDSIPANGIYLLFEAGEHGHGLDRIVRTGTHTGQGQLRGRLEEHYLIENKDRSIFRKNIGRALLSRESDPFLEQWNIDLTTREARRELEHTIDATTQSEVERRVSHYIRRNFSFIVLEVTDGAERLALNRRLIGTIASCSDCSPSEEWLGNESPKPKIRDAGLWQEQHLAVEPLAVEDVARLADFLC